MQLRSPLLIVLSAFVLLPHSELLGESARTLLPFQGHLTDATGYVVPDGPRLLQFRIYDAPVAGSAVWAGEVHRTTVNGGLVNVILGSKASLEELNFNRPLYLEITVDVDGDQVITAADPPLLPRQVLLPAVFAKESAVSRDSHALAGHDWSALLDINDPVVGKLSGTKLADGSITGAQLAQGAVSARELADGGVNSPKLAERAVTSDKLATEGVLLQNLAAEVARRLVPAGTIVVFGGDTVPEGWFLCDGSVKDRTTYAALFGAIGTAWGTGNGSSTFNLPDLRGLFLRGVDGDANRDPDKASRTAINAGGNPGPLVGSYQADIFGKHTHAERPGPGTQWYEVWRRTDGNWPSERDGNVLGSRTGESGGSETRPKNAYVHYIIKY